MSVPGDSLLAGARTQRGHPACTTPIDESSETPFTEAIRLNEREIANALIECRSPDKCAGGCGFALGGGRSVWYRAADISLICFLLTAPQFKSSTATRGT
jgi:hypothetical protein